jgi:type IV pilus assembly protein PilM
MKKSDKFAAFNLGMQTVTLAVFQAAPGAPPTLVGLAKSELVPDPAADASRANQLAVVLKELKGKLAWQSSACACAIPSQGVFARFVQIPRVEPDKLDQVLFFEAQQNVPYPIEEVVWSYQLLPARSEEILGVLLVATKTDALESTAEALRAAKLRPQFLETSPTAIYNAYRYNYPDAEGCSLIIDIGARTTNLIFAEDENFFIRTLPIGGSSITTAVQKQFETRSFNEVEAIKRSEGFIPPSGGHHGDTSHDIAELGKIARTVMTRVHNEITRSIAFYRTNQSGSQPVRVLLAGGSAAFPYCAEFFHEKLSLPVEFFNPLRRISVAPDVDAGLVEQTAHTLGECVGLAIRQSGESAPSSLSLKVPSIERDAADVRRRPFLAAAAAVFVGSIAVLGGYWASAASFVQRINEETQSSLQPLQALQDRIQRASAERDKLLSEGADFVSLPFLRTAWSAILHELNQRQPPKYLWITKLAPYPAVPGFSATETVAAPSQSDADQAADSDSAGPMVTALSIEGLYIENENGPGVVDEFVDALASSDLFDINDENKGKIVEVRAAQTGDRWAYDYRLLVPLKRPLPL